MPREMCLACMRPRSSCLCPSDPPLQTRTRIVLLMHPKEHHRQKCTTGRLTCLNLANSEIIPGIRFDEHPRVRELVDDPANLALLLYPGPRAIRLRGGRVDGLAPGGRRLVVFLVDATWHCARTIVRESPSLLSLPRLMIEPSSPSRFRIKHQPAPWCLSTIEATHELLLALEAAGLDEYTDKARLLAAFDAMQDFQVRQTARAAVRTTHRVRGVREPLPGGPSTEHDDPASAQEGR
jgi:DTW domain-containing protein